MNSVAQHRPLRSRGAFGFILPLTLWMIAILGLVASVINVWVGRTVADSRTLAQRVQMELVQSDVRNELVYMMARRPTSYRGLEIGPRVGAVSANNFIGLMSGALDSGRTLKMDGRPYSATDDPNIILKIQDAYGLLNLNTMAPQNLRRMLTVLDIPDPQINALTDTLLDYIDDDDLTRQAGAERTQYERLNLPPPSNAFLATPYEAQRALGWDKLDLLWKNDAESPILTTCRTGSLNLNTAPATALMATIPGMTRGKAEQVIARRQEKPFRGAREVGAVADLLMADEPFLYGFVPGPCMLVDIIDKRSGQRARFSLTLDRLSQTKPWRVDYEIRIPSEDRAALDQLSPESAFPTPESIDPPDGGNAVRPPGQ